MTNPAPSHEGERVLATNKKGEPVDPSKADLIEVEMADGSHTILTTRDENGNAKDPFGP